MFKGLFRKSKESKLKPIIILATPRVGSNMLMFSLAEHPKALCGGEWHCDDPTRCWPPWLANRNSGDANLIKIFNMESIPFEGLLVGLYREDIQAQLASWRKASETGEWLAGLKLPVTPMDENAEKIIEEANSRIMTICDITISYETMVENWDANIKKILTGANWPVRRLPIATKKQS